MEVYEENRFVVFTGELLKPECPICHSQAGLNWLVEKVFASKAKQAPKRITDRKSAREPLLESDDQLLERALAKDEKFRRLFSGDWSDYPSQSEADLALSAKLAFWWYVPDTGGRDAIDRIYRLGEFYQQWREK